MKRFLKIFFENPMCTGKSCVHLKIPSHPGTGWDGIGQDETGDCTNPVEHSLKRIKNF